MEKRKASLKRKENFILIEPRLFKVMIHNDDYTAPNCIIKILVRVFYKSNSEAETIMMQIHKLQVAVIGIYPYDIAKTKINKATIMARSEGFPLRLTIIPEN